MVDLSSVPLQRLEDMAAAAGEIRECERLLGKTQHNVVSEVLRGGGEFYEWDHYPAGDVFDPETHAQYYYHAHPAELRGGEHGHFHTFLRPKGMPPGIAPAPLADHVPSGGDNDALSHLVAISMDSFGAPVRLFTTNRWVTGEVWYAAADVIRMLDRFRMDLSYPSLTVNTWMTAMVRLFRPQIEALLRQRDAAVAAWQAQAPEGNAYEDRDLEIPSVTEISAEAQIRAVEAERARRRTAP